MNKPSFFLENISLKDETYYAIGGRTQFLSRPKSFQEVVETIHFCRKEKLPCALLGEGTNSLYSDEFFPGVVLTLSALNQWTFESDDHLLVEAGLTNTDISNIALEKGFEDLAWMYRMPGMIGASVRMNARCYGSEMKDVASDVIAVDSLGHFQLFSNRDVFHGYKDTIFMKNPAVILAVRFRLQQKNCRENILKKMQSCLDDRNKKSHFLYPSCGSTFKNNYAVGKPSGKIFDELGFRGQRQGNAQVSQHHGNFIWNLGHASARDILTLAARMRKAALTQKNADLELEVQPVGLFSTEEFQDCAMGKLGPHVTVSQKKLMGLFWHPKFSAPDSKFPYPVLHSPFYPYFISSQSQGFPNISCKVEQLHPLAEAKKDPQKPFLRWTTFCTKEHIQKIFSLTCPQQTEKFVSGNLWEYSVSELFLGHPSQTQGYLEFEMTPQGHWTALKFDDLRMRNKENPTPQKTLWEKITTQKNENFFALEIPFAIIQNHVDSQNKILMHGALSLGHGKYFLTFPIHNQETPAPRADFHLWRHFSPLQLVE